jgi:putative FmdB family regulatory protein
MPTYEYRCKNHGHIFEFEPKMSDPPLTSCEICDAVVERLIGCPPSFARIQPAVLIRRTSGPTSTSMRRRARGPLAPPKKIKKKSGKTGTKSPIPGCRGDSYSQLQLSDQ